MGAQAVALLSTLNAECDSVERLGEATIAAFTQHPDHEIITSFVGLGDLTGARVLGEIGDDGTRFTDERSLKAFAGSAPVTKASGRSVNVTHRRVKNNRLAAVGFVWAFVAAGRDGPSREHYLTRREHGDSHPAALRHLFNRMLGQLYHCLQTGQTYDRDKAFPPRSTQPEPLRLDTYQDRRSVDEDLLGGFGLWGFVGSFDELAVDEQGARADERDQMGGVDRAPPVLGGLDQLERHRQPGRTGSGTAGDLGEVPHGRALFGEPDRMTAALAPRRTRDEGDLPSK